MLQPNMLGNIMNVAITELLNTDKIMAQSDEVWTLAADNYHLSSPCTL